MSENDRKKELNEEKCLDDAIRLAKSKRAMTRNIMNMLSGTTVTRAKNDRPDIIRIWHSNNPNEGDIFIGIEHFLVDQAIEIRKKKNKSVGAECRSHIRRSYEAGHSAVEKSQSIPDEVKEKLVNDAFKLAMVTNESGYEELLESLKTNLTAHAKRAKAYRDEIQKFAGNHPIKLALLLEIHCYFPHLFLNIGHTTSPNVNGLMPMFSEVVDELEKVDAAFVDYIILYIKNMVDKSKANIIAVKAGSVTKDLRSQAIPIYKYCGEKNGLKFTNVQCEKTNDEGYQYHYNIKYADNIDQMEMYVPALKAAYTAFHQGKAFAAPRNIQSFLFSFGNDVEFSSNPDNDLLFSVHGIDKTEMLRRFDEFTAKYPIGDECNEQT